MPRLHERLRKLIPQTVKDIVPETVKEKLRPPAWREPVVEAPEWAKSKGKVKWVLGTPAMVFAADPAAGGAITVTKDAKGYPLPAPVTLPYGTEGTVTAVGPTWVVFQPNSSEEGYRVYNPDDSLNPLLPESERKWGRRGLIEVTLADLEVAHARA